jgi:EmrB/QacA subfamily drug resistance transporter
MTASAAAPRAARAGITLLAASTAIVMVEIDKLAVNVALPAIAGDLHQGLAELQWTISAYMLAMAALLIPGGRLGDVLGRRRLYLLGIGVFALASLACGLAQNATELIVGRAAQGVGAAAMYPATSALLATAYPPERRGWAQGMLAAAAGFGMAAGPLVGGVLVEGLSWRWIFFVNPIISIGAIVLTLGWVAEQRDPHADRRQDPLGLITLATGVVAVLFACIQAGAGDLAPALVAGAAGLGLLAAFVAIERRSAAPLLDLELLGRPGFAGIQVAASIAMLAIIAWLFVTTLELQDVYGHSAVHTGLLLLPYVIAFTALSSRFGALTDRVGVRGPLAGGLVLLGVAMALLAALCGPVGYDRLWPAFALVGVAQALIWPGLSTGTINIAGPERAGVATGVLQAGRWLGGAFGVAAIGGIYAAAQRLSDGGDGLAAALATIAVCALLGAVVSERMLRAAP